MALRALSEASYFPALDDNFVVGYRLVSRNPVDYLVPITAGRDDLRTGK